MAATGRRLWAASLMLLLATGCPPGSTILYGAGSGGASGPFASGSGSTGDGSTTSGGTSSGTAGAPNPPSPYVDGGYVFCNLPDAADAGAFGDGGAAVWMCQLGTTICDLRGTIGSCFECQSDGDCENPALPGYDPQRRHCDLKSGVRGYQGFCQGCVENVDCAGNLSGRLCNLNPSYPPGALEPPINLVGFETCGTLLTDCRLDGGPLCGGLNQICDGDSGICIQRSSACSTDKDCEGILSADYLLTPYCVSGICNPCQGNDCERVCIGSLECAGFWPACEGIDGGRVNGLGEPIGICGCDADSQCDGLICFPAGGPIGSQAGACGVPCTSPQFPPCSSLFPYAPVCDPTTGLCTGCMSDDQCQANSFTGGPICFPIGVCGCGADAGCPIGQTCDQDFEGVATCGVSLPQCVYSSCAESGFCNWDSGICESFGSCLADSDCGSQLPFCDPLSLECVECRTSLDCSKTGLAGQNCMKGQCTDSCGSNLDCLGNPRGPACVEHPEGLVCGCVQDQDCAGNDAGPRCDNNDAGDPMYGGCGCLRSSDCKPGQSCRSFEPGVTPFGECLAGCQTDADCAPDTYCAPGLMCRPRCDDGHICFGVDLFCDHDDVAGLNFGEEVWCYQCLDGTACAASDGCHLWSCGRCATTSECASGRVCVGGMCQPMCESNRCPDGEFCDTLGVGGYGPNICLPCVTAAECSDGLGCNRDTHACGTCVSPSVQSIPPDEGFDCPPDSICSTYWEDAQTGVCLASCDLRSCPAYQPLCAVIPSLTTAHRYCVGCLHDSDCADAGPGAWCDVSVNRTYRCQAAP